jgi:hypothetical protein
VGVRRGYADGVWVWRWGDQSPRRCHPRPTLCDGACSRRARAQMEVEEVWSRSCVGEALGAAKQAVRLCACAASDAVERWVEDSGGVGALVCGATMAQASHSTVTVARDRCLEGRCQMGNPGLKGEESRRGD